LKNERRLRFENTVLRKTFGAERDEVTGEWRAIHNEELYDLYCLPNIVRVIKTGRMRCSGHVSRIGKMRVHTGFWWGNLWERGNSEDLTVVGE
jgi:hypothetical protein